MFIRSPTLYIPNKFNRFTSVLSIFNASTGKEIRDFSVLSLSIILDLYIESLTE